MQNGDSASYLEWKRDRALSEWTQSMHALRGRIMTSRSKLRIAFLLEEVLPLVAHGDMDESQMLDIFDLLCYTYPRYVDAPSREAVEEVLFELVRRAELDLSSSKSSKECKGVTLHILRWLTNEGAQMSRNGSLRCFSPADKFVLLSWSCGLYTTCLQANPDFPSTAAWPLLVGNLATLADSMMHESTPSKRTMQKSAVRRLRRALRSTSEKLPNLVETLVSQARSSQFPLTLVPLLGNAIDIMFRLRKVDECPVRGPLSMKDDILSIYASSVIMSKVPVRSHVLKSLRQFIEKSVSEDDLVQRILPLIDKAFLRSPEISLNVISDFFLAYSQPLSSEIARKLVSSVTNAAKSSNVIVRRSSVDLFSVIVQKCSADDMRSVADEILNLCKAGKTAGPDHRIALYSMLSFVRPSTQISPSFIQNAILLIPKDNHDAALATLASTLPPHVTYLLKIDVSLPPDVVSLISKEMTNAKPIIRRAFCTLAGRALWELGDLTSEASLDFATAVSSSFESNLKDAAANPLNSPAGPIEGYIALAVLLGPCYRSEKYDDSLSRNSTIQSMTTVSTRPPFLLWDKVFLKLNRIEDEIWLLRAMATALIFFKTELSKNKQLRTQVGLVFFYLAVDSVSSEVRRATLKVLEDSVPLLPELSNHILTEALGAAMSRDSSISLKAGINNPDADNVEVDKQSRLAAFLRCCVTFKEQVDSALRDKLLVQLIILAHHPLINGSSRQLWIELCLKARVDPHDLVSRHAAQIFKQILAASAIDSKFGFMEASYSTVRTVVFVSPEVALPIVMDQLRADIHAEAINSLTDDDFAIWATPEGSTYIDVLSSRKQTTEAPQKGKGADIAKWEADLRRSLASKKTTSVTLTKQEQAAVQEQLEKEAVIRQRVTALKLNLERGLAFVKSVVSAHIPAFQVFFASVVSMVINGALNKGPRMVGSLAFDTFLELAQCTSDRLQTYRQWVGICTLRSLQIASVPEEFQVERLNSLVTRVLYRLRSLSESVPFDAATFAYAFPLLEQIMVRGGVDTDNEDQVLEQIALVLDIVKFHCTEFNNSNFPREEVLQNLILVIRQQPRLSKEASSALVDVGATIAPAPTREETSILIKGTLLQEVYVRQSCLQALQPFDLTDVDWSPELWLACHDDDEQNARLAQQVWEENGLDVPETFLSDLLPFLDFDNLYVRQSSAASIAEAVEHWPQSVHSTLAALQNLYSEKAKILAPEFDEFGMVIAQSLDRSDPWPTRLAIGITLEQIAPSFSEANVEPFFSFLIDKEALGDRSPEVRRGMLNAGIAVVDRHGAVRLTGLISTFEQYLARPDSKTEGSHQIKEAVIILFGRVARHLDSSDPRIPEIVERLVDALKTPSEQVQIAVSDCLIGLVKLMKPSASNLIDHLFDQMFNGSKYAARRGAAYGIAGVVKGLGIGSIKEFNILARLHAAAEDKKRFEPRQGAMFAFETLCTTLDRLFEPYIVFVLPFLLTAFGDATVDVREAAQDAARVIMGHMSGYGVKLILPSLLSGLDEKQWRTKKGSIELLGMMAYCSPRQLSLSLPIVIPRLTSVLTDTHAQVKAAANKSLKQFGEVISNPEIQSLVPVLLKALVDPARTPVALASLLKTSFMHQIDHSSLALVVPILERGLRERGAETKKKAAQITGNLASLTDSKDFVPYLSILLPMIHGVLVDPVPEARATAAKALGTLVERLGEVHFPNLVPGLLKTLKTDTSGVDRQGAAQGLSEVLSGLGMERLEGLLPDIIANAQSPRSTVREGFMSLLVYLPATFGARFQPHLPRIISPILGGLSDSEEFVREAAMRAGRMIVANYSNKAIDLLLPELELGMFDPGWRIRQSSITLVGELLFKVSGISGKAEIEEAEDVADAAVAESSRRALAEVLGAERRDRILSALYLARQDAVSVVRQSSIHIWKALVHNTPRTVREILPELVSQVVKLVSSSEFEQQETATRTTSELCRKFGEKILGEIIPILKENSSTSDPRVRQGVCQMLCDIMDNTTDNQRENHEDDIVAMVRNSLVDDAADVRTAAARAFDSLQEHIGPKAIDQTIPTLLEALREPGESSGTALQALKEVMSVRASTVFPVLIPTLLSTPMTVFNARALGTLVKVAGNALSKRLTVILSALVKVIEGNSDSEVSTAVDESLHSLLGSISDPEGLNTLMLLLLGWAKHESPARRVSACRLFAIFCVESQLDASLYRVDWIRQLVSLFEDLQVAVHTAAWQAFDTFVKALPKDELEPLVVPLRRTIEGMGGPGQHVPGFSLPKGVAPTVPIIIAGLTTGSHEQRENAAYSIGELVERTEESAIKPYVVPFTGPLIRVATQATTYPPGVKTAILRSLAVMLERIPAHVKPFFPQLQRTFIKSVSDPSSLVVRTRAAEGLGVLMRHQPRVDPVVVELLVGAKTNDEEVEASFILALANVVQSAQVHGGIGEKARESCVELVLDAFRETRNEHYVQSVAQLFVALSTYTDAIRPIVNAQLVSGTPASSLASQIIFAILSPDNPSHSETQDILFSRLGVLRSVALKVKESVANERPAIARPAREARDILKALLTEGEDNLTGIF